MGDKMGGNTWLKAPTSASSPSCSLQAYARVRDEFLQGAGRKILARDQDQRHLGDERRRGEVGRGVVGRLEL